MEDETRKIPILEVAVISVERHPESEVQLGPEEDVEVLTTEDVYEETEPWRWDEGAGPIGVLDLQMTRPEEGDRVLLNATFTFDTVDEKGTERKDSLELSGPATRSKGKLERGRLGKGSGTGRFRDFQGTVAFEHRNPKRWSVGGGG